MIKKLILGVIGLSVILLIAIQLVPFGREHTNPSVQAEPKWDSPQTRALAKRACFDCHSNETVWPWYSNIAPVSWVLQRNVNEGRSKLNFSEWNRPQNKAREAAEAVQKGEMPEKMYLPLHPEANLSAQEKQALINGLNATLGNGGRRP